MNLSELCLEVSSSSSSIPAITFVFFENQVHGIITISLKISVPDTKNTKPTAYNQLKSSHPNIRLIAQIVKVLVQSRVDLCAAEANFVTEIPEAL